MLPGTQKVAAPHLQLAELIREEIIAEEYRPGDQLPSQQLLAAKYRTSLITVKRALNLLKDEGLIYGEPGKGVYVSFPVRGRSDGQQAEVTVVVLIEPPLSPFFSGIARGICEAVSEQGWDVVFPNGSPCGKEADSPASRSKGFIVGIRTPDGKVMNSVSELRAGGHPVVMVSYTEDPNADYVGVDHVRGAYVATRHLVELGYRSICYVTPEPKNPLSLLRYRGFLQACEEKPGVEPRVLGPAPGDSPTPNRYRAGYELGLRMVDMGDFPEACFAFTDLVALGLIRALQENAVDVPNEVAVVGFDDIPLAESSAVPLTTVRQPLKEIGYLAVDVLRRRLKGEKGPIRILLEPELVVRESCGASLRK